MACAFCLDDVVGLGGIFGDIVAVHVNEKTIVIAVVSLCGVVGVFHFLVDICVNVHDFVKAHCVNEAFHFGGHIVHLDKSKFLED